MPIDSETAIRLPPWRALLRGARQREGRSAGATWLQLATAAPDGTPRVRTLVFRGWSSTVLGALGQSWGSQRNNDSSQSMSNQNT